MRTRLRGALAGATVVVSLVVPGLVASGCGGGHGSGSGSLAAGSTAPIGSASPAPVGSGTAPGSTTGPGSSAPGSSGPTTGPLAGDPLAAVSVASGTFRDALGRHLLLRGVNLSERSKQPPFAGWLTPAHVDAIQAFGVDHVRFLLTWDAIEPQDGVFDDAYLAQVATELSWFEARGIYVVLDMHQDEFARRFGGDGFPEWMIPAPDPFPFLPDVIGSFPLNYVNPKVNAAFDSFWTDPVKRARLAKAWAHAVSRLASSKAVVGYDLLNEPWPGPRVPWDFESSLLAPLEAELAAAIRAQDPDRVIFFEGQMQAGLFAPTGLARPNGDPNACYAPHWYDPVVDVRSALGLGAYDGNWNRTSDAFDRLTGHAAKLGTALWLGEYGIERLRANSDQYLLDHHRLLDARLWPACCWNVNPVSADVFSPLDPNGQPYPSAAPGGVSAWAHPHPRAVAGTLASTSYDPASRTLEVHWSEGNLGPNAPTIVELPLAAYPAGAGLDVTLSDAAGTWRSERDAATGRLLVWADPAASSHALVVKPH